MYDYTKKYQKYKTKYLELKKIYNQLGGNNLKIKIPNWVLIEN